MSKIGEPMDTAPPSVVANATTVGFWKGLATHFTEIRERLEGEVTRIASSVTQSTEKFGTTSGWSFYDAGKVVWRVSQFFITIGGASIATFSSTLISLTKNVLMSGTLQFSRANPQTIAAGDTIAVSRVLVNTANATGLATTMTSTPTIQTSGIQQGTFIILINEGNGDLILQADTTLAGSALILGGAATVTIPGNCVTILQFVVTKWRLFSAIAL